MFPDAHKPTAAALDLVDEAAEPTAATEPAARGSNLPAKSKPRPARVRGQWWEVKESGHNSDDVVPGPGVPEEVSDCVRYSTLPARHNCGEVMWLGYTCLGKRKSDTITGMGFLMATKFVAKVVEGATRKDECERGPIDRTFKKWLLSGPESSHHSFASRMCFLQLEASKHIIRR